MLKVRLDNELPESTEKWGWKYHHLRIPTDKIMPDEEYLPQFRLYVSGFSKSPFGIECMRYGEDSKRLYRLLYTHYPEIITKTKR